MSEQMRTVLSHQHRRLVGTVMRHVEAEVYPHLTQTQQRALREVVIRAAGAYHDTALDIVRALGEAEGEIVNEQVQQILHAIDRHLSAPRMR